MHRFNDNLVHWNSNEELLRALVAENVDFVLIGGLAIAWYCESRQADDMDLLVKPTAENAERIRKALSSVNVQGFDAAAFAGAGAQLQIRDRYYAELLTPALGGPAYEEIAQASEPAKLFGTPIRVPSRAMLVRLKLRAITTQAEAKEKHLADVELLLAGPVAGAGEP